MWVFSEFLIEEGVGGGIVLLGRLVLFTPLRPDISGLLPSSKGRRNIESLCGGMSECYSQICNRILKKYGEI